jgi:8-oxo-dGTP diphosphatase
MRRSPPIVVAAVVEREGMILIGQRKQGDRHGLKWEFPGGKVEELESPRDALVRELREELGIEAVIDSEIVRYEHQYPNRPKFLLIFYRVREFQGEPVNLAFQTIVWERPENLRQYDFLDGDIDFIRRLARGEL